VIGSDERNTLLRSLLGVVMVACTPFSERVRVLAYDSAIELPADGRGERPTGIRPIRLPDLDDPGVLRMPGGEDGPQRGGGV
jgi:hypothetical protein